MYALTNENKLVTLILKREDKNKVYNLNILDHSVKITGTLNNIEITDNRFLIATFTDEPFIEIYSKGFKFIKRISFEKIGIEMIH